MNYCLYIRSWLWTLPSERVSDTEHWDVDGLKKQASSCESQDKRGGTSRNSAFTRCCSLLRGWIRDLSHPSLVSPLKFSLRWRICVASWERRVAMTMPVLMNWFEMNIVEGEEREDQHMCFCLSFCSTVSARLWVNGISISLCLFIH